MLTSTPFSSNNLHKIDLRNFLGTQQMTKDSIWYVFHSLLPSALPHLRFQPKHLQKVNLIYFPPSAALPQLSSFIQPKLFASAVTTFLSRANKYSNHPLEYSKYHLEYSKYLLIYQIWKTYNREEKGQSGKVGMDCGWTSYKLDFLVTLTFPPYKWVLGKGKAHKLWWFKRMYPLPLKMVECYCQKILAEKF